MRLMIEISDSGVKGCGYYNPIARAHLTGIDCFDSEHDPVEQSERLGRLAEVLMQTTRTFYSEWFNNKFLDAKKEESSSKEHEAV